MDKKLFETTLKKHKHLLIEGRFGLEKENVRVNLDGTLALTPHPSVFGNKGKHPYITTDFSESQIEMITPPLNSIPQAIGFMTTLHDIVTDNIGNELLWTQSLPPFLEKNQEIPIAKYSDEFKHKEVYRHKLATVYGKEQQLISGIHFNFSFPDELMNIILKSNSCGDNIEQVRETIYFRVIRNLIKYRWLFVWLYGESPLADESFNTKSCCEPSLQTSKNEKEESCVGLSMRTSPIGYRNKEDYYINYSSLENYKNSICKLVSEKQIDSEQELYLPVRLKFLPKSGKAPAYIEFRIVDLDPFTHSGVCKNAIYFCHLLVIYSLLKNENGSLSESHLKIASKNQDLASCYGRNEKQELICCTTSLQNRAQQILLDMHILLSEFGILDNLEYKKEIEHNLYIANNPEERIGIKLYHKIKEEGYINFHLNQAKQHKERSIKKGYQFFGYEDMEMSTQLLLKAALLKGIEFEIVDKNENFIRLFNKQKEEYVMQATKTSLDNYVSILMMENKVVTKKVLNNAHITVPKGKEYTTIERALCDFEMFKNRAIVVKPKSTNFGLGISILKNNDNINDFKTSLEIAFQHDNTLLIEEFIEGREFRIFIINDQVVGILHRVPANVCGNGQNTLSQLIDIKNQNPLRGVGYHTPLEKIKKGQEEALFLKQQNLNFDSIPQKDKIVYLRENSNISTGGDSIDFTDDIHPSYKAIAIKAAQKMKVNITGLDMMIQDINTEATPNNYAIIEMNFNPAIHIHCYPLVGKNRKLNFKILDALGF